MNADVIDALWAQIEPIVFISRDQFVSGLEQWDIDPVHIDGELAFVALTQGPEFHFTSFETGAQISRDMIRSRLHAIIERHGYVTTRTPIEGANRQHRFNRILGFHVTGTSEFFVDYRLDRKCP
jgi:hypothetical protein